MVSKTKMGKKNGGGRRGARWPQACFLAGVALIIIILGTTTLSAVEATSWPLSLKSTSANVTINGTVEGDSLGVSVSSGDINGDGYDDLIIGAYHANPNRLNDAGQA